MFESLNNSQKRIYSLILSLCLIVLFLFAKSFYDKSHKSKVLESVTTKAQVQVQGDKTDVEKFKGAAAKLDGDGLIDSVPGINRVQSKEDSTDRGLLGPRELAPVTHTDGENIQGHVTNSERGIATQLHYSQAVETASPELLPKDLTPVVPLCFKTRGFDDNNDIIETVVCE